MISRKRFARTSTYDHKKLKEYAGIGRLFLWGYVLLAPEAL